MDRAYTNVMAFVDWNSQIHNYGSDAMEPKEYSRRALEGVARRISSCLSAVESDRRFKVSLRIYHGWHKGFEPTKNNKAIKTALAEADFPGLSSRSNVIFSEDVAFGDKLIMALQQRMHSKPSIHLPNTCRSRGYKGEEEKMVDTAIAADLIVTAFRDPQDWILVAAEDDDVIPPLYVAEAAMKMSGSSARVLFIPKRRVDKNFFLMDGIVVEGVK